MQIHINVVAKLGCKIPLEVSMVAVFCNNMYECGTHTIRKE
jgi:hypothetical protein